MESRLLVSALVIGLVGWLCGLLYSRSPRPGTFPEMPFPRAFLFAAAFLPIVVFLITLPSRPPVFAGGHGLGWGFLLGGFGALLAAWTLFRLLRIETSDWRGTRAALTASTPCFLAVATLTLPRLFLHDVAVDALAGVAIGWLCVSFILLLGIGSGKAVGGGTSVSEAADGADTARTKALALALVAGVGFTTLVSGVAILGEYRDLLDLTTESSIHWSVLGIVMAAAVPLLLLIGGLPAPFFAGLAHRVGLAPLLARLFGSMTATEDAQRAGTRAWRVLGTCLLLALFGYLLTRRVQDSTDGEHLQKHLFQIIVFGVLGGLLAWWLTAARLRRESDPEAPQTAGWQGSAVTALVILSGVMVAYQTMAGFGVGLLILSAWLPLILAVTSALDEAFQYRTGAGMASPNVVTAEVAQRLLKVILFAVMLVVYRAFYTRFSEELTGVTLTDHYAVFGFLFGAAVPAMLSEYVLRAVGTRRAASAEGLTRLFVAGALTLGIPTLIIALWGAKCALAMMIGLALSTVVNEGNVFRPQSDSASDGVAQAYAAGFLPALFALAIGLALMQWTAHVVPLAQLTRLQKVHVIEGVAGSLILLLALADVGGRLRMRKLEQGGPAVAPVSGGVGR